MRVCCAKRMRSVRYLVLATAWTCHSDGAGAPDPAEAPGPSRLTHVVPASIDATGTNDVTVALNSFFTSVPDGSTITFPKGATYRVEGTLLFTNRYDLTLNGQGATILARTDGSAVIPPPSLSHRWPRGRRHILFVGGSGVVVRNISVVGPNPFAGTSEAAYVASLEAQHAFEFAGVNGVLVDSVRATDIYGDFVYLGPNGSSWSSNVTVTNSHFDRNGRQGIAITGARHVLVANNYVGNVRRTSVDIEPNTAAGGAQQIVIRGNTFGPTRLNLLSSVGAAGLVDNITVDSNILIGHALKIAVAPPAGSRRSRFRILSNTSNQEFGSPIAAMNFTRVDSIDVRGNVQPFAAARLMTAVRALESCGVLVAGNVFTGALRHTDIQAAVCP
jgi:hypothetical protein